MVVDTTKSIFAEEPVAPGNSHPSWSELTRMVWKALNAADNGGTTTTMGFADDEQVLILTQIGVHHSYKKFWWMARCLTREFLEDELRCGELTASSWDFQPLPEGVTLGLEDVPGSVTALFGRLISTFDGKPLERVLVNETTGIVLEHDLAKATHALVRVEIPSEQINLFLTKVYRGHDLASDIFSREDIRAGRGETSAVQPSVYYLVMDLAMTRELGWY